MTWSILETDLYPPVPPFSYPSSVYTINFYRCKLDDYFDTVTLQIALKHFGKISIVMMVPIMIRSASLAVIVGMRRTMPSTNQLAQGVAVIMWEKPSAGHMSRRFNECFSKIRCTLKPTQLCEWKTYRRRI